MSLKLVRGIERKSKKIITPYIRTFCPLLNSETGKHAVGATIRVTILFAQWKWSNFCMKECENYNEERRKERKVAGILKVYCS
jgi:hypothetical protein